MPILAAHPSNLIGKGKDQHLLSAHKKSHFSAPFWGFRLRGCLDSRTGWEEVGRGKKDKGKALCRFCLGGKSQRSKGREAAAP